VTDRETPPGTPIVPRWEWRTFGESFGTADATLDSLGPGRVVESDEVYLLSLHGDASVKVRDDLMDVKELQQTGDDGLELWKPVMKAAFPLAADDVASVYGALNVPVPRLERAAYSLDEVERELIDVAPALRAVRVHKLRRRYVIDECMVEVTDLTAEGASTRTVDVESPDPELVTATIAKLGLAGRSNVCLAKGLKALLGFGARRYAVIDVGTNSVKFHVAERRADGQLVTIIDRAEVTRLGEGLAESGRLADEAVTRTVAAIVAMIDEAIAQRVDGISAVGTAGLRRAPNRDALLDAVEAERGIHVEVITGEEESRLAYLAATSALPAHQGSLVVFDSGGGSTQFTFGESQLIDERFSLDVGAVIEAERYGLEGEVSGEELEQALAGIAADFDRLAGRPRPDAIVAIGGTATNLAAVKHGLAQYDPDVVHGTVLDLAEVDRQIELYRARDAEGRREVVGLQPARAEVILAGACIVRTILTTLDHTSLTVSDRGLRHGVMIDRYGG
jgi:exopolyphosphatase/guanosine-5'-triphosphate,3'-diphosphate pyrophosphatase